MEFNDFPGRCGRPNDGYNIEMDHNMDGSLDGQDVDAYIDNIAQGGPKSSQELLRLQAAGCDIDAIDLKDFVAAGGNLSGRDVVSFVANGGEITAQDFNDLKNAGVRFDSEQTIIMESAMQVDLNGDGKMAGSHVAREYLARYETPRPGDGFDIPPQYFTQDPFGSPFPPQNPLDPYGIPNGFNGGIPYANPLDYNYLF